MRDTERAEVAAFRTLASGLPGPGTFASAGDALAVRCPLAGTELNRILGLEAIAQLDELEPLFEDGRIVVSLDPATGLEPKLAARGFAPGYPWQKFVREPAPLHAETSLAVEPARRPEHFAHAAVHGYGLTAAFEPWAAGLVGRAGWHCLVAYDGATPVATGVLHVAEDVGWVGVGATLPEYRGRGAQSALLAARVSLAHELGLRLLVTETGVPRDGRPGPSYRNILRAGFREAYVRPNLVKDAA